MNFSKTLFLISWMTFFCHDLLVAQEPLLKLKGKHLVGNWISKDNFNSIKTNPVLTFYKTADEQMNDSTQTLFKLNKSETMKIIQRNTSKQDTLTATWFFVEGSKNLKVTQKIKTEGSISVKSSNGTQTDSNYYITAVSTFHVEFISDNKLILRYVN